MPDDEANVEGGHYADDIIELGGKSFVVTGGVRGQSASEFQTGLKIGAATYDSREHAFFLVLDDFTGGFGHRVLDVRTALGTHYDNEGGVDLRRPRHITLPPKRTDLHINDAAIIPDDMGLFFVNHTMVVSDISGTTQLYLGIGNAVCTLDADRTTVTRVALLSGFDNIHRIIEFRSSLDSEKALYVFGHGDPGRSYYRSTDGVNFNEADSYSAHDISEATIYDGQLVAFKEDGFAIISSADGLNWSSEDINVGNIWIPNNFVQFVGNAMAPWGYAAPYFLDQGQLWVLNFYAHKAMRIEELGDNMFLHDGVVYNGSIFVTDGHNIWSYNPGASETVRHLGPFGKDGVPTSWHEGKWSVVSFMPGTSSLFATCRRNDATVYTPEKQTTRLLVYTGIGWTWFGPETISDDPPGNFVGGTPYSGIVDRFPLDASLSVPTRAIDVVSAFFFSPTDFTIHTWSLPQAGDVPYVGSDATFEDGPLSFETGWYDGGFAELEGVLLRMSIDAFHLTPDEYVQIDYRLDNREEDNWTPLGVFTHNHEHLWFSEDHRGVEFKTVQFRVTLNRETATPPILSDCGDTPDPYDFTTEGSDLVELVEGQSYFITATTVGGAEGESDSNWYAMMVQIDFPGNGVVNVSPTGYEYNWNNPQYEVVHIDGSCEETYTLPGDGTCINFHSAFSFDVIEVGTPIVACETKNIDTVSFWLQKFGAPAADIVFHLYANDGGAVGEEIGVSAPFDGSSLIAGDCDVPSDFTKVTLAIRKPGGAGPPVFDEAAYDAALAAYDACVAAAQAAYDAALANQTVSLTKTPELRSLILYWDKKSNLRMSWTTTVDLVRTVERGFAESVRDAWQNLVGVYNTKKLVPFTFKSLEGLDLNVRVASYIPNFQEVRLDDTTWGTLAITLLEPLS